MKAYFDKSVSDILIIKHVLMYQHIPVINDVQIALWCNPEMNVQ